MLGDNGSSHEVDKIQQEQQEQIDQNNADIATKTKALYDTRLDILKSQGGTDWNPPSTVTSTPPPQGKQPKGNAFAQPIVPNKGQR